MWFRSRYVDEYVVDTSGLTREHEVAACRGALELVAPEVDRFQFDVLWRPHHDSLADDVIQAALVFVPHEQEYESTKGWITEFSEDVWQAFVMFAPYALSADAYTRDMTYLVGLDDEGRSIGLRILPDQLQQFEASVPGARVVPLKEWRRLPRSKRWRN